MPLKIAKNPRKLDRNFGKHQNPSPGYKLNPISKFNFTFFNLDLVEWKFKFLKIFFAGFIDF